MAKRRKVEYTLDNVLDKMQQAYRDIDEQKSDLMGSIQERKLRFKSEDIEEEVELSGANHNDQKLLDRLIDKKIKLIEIHSKLIAPKLKSNIEEKEDEIQKVEQLSDEATAHLRKIALDNLKKEIKYDL